MASGDAVLDHLHLEPITGLDAGNELQMASYSSLLTRPGAAGSHPETILETYNFTKQAEYRYLHLLGEVVNGAAVTGNLVVKFVFYQDTALANNFHFEVALSPIVPGASGTDPTVAYTLTWETLEHPAINAIKRPNPISITVPQASHGITAADQVVVMLRRSGNAPDTALGGALVPVSSVRVVEP